MNRLWIAPCLSGMFMFTAAATTCAQERGAETGGGAAPSAATETNGAPTAPGGASSVLTPGPMSSGGGTASPLPSSTGATAPSGSNALSEGVPSATNQAAAAPPTTLSVPGGYGFSSKVFTLGEGRLAQPPLRFTVSLSQGYDDNVFSSPRHPVTVEGQSASLPRTGSAVTNGRLGVQFQAANPRTLFTVDGSGGALLYWSRPGGAVDYTASLGTNLVHRITPRATVTLQGDAVYQKQPDFSRINSPATQSGGNYLSIDSKIDFDYRWTSRVSTLTSYIFNATVQEKSTTGTLYQNIVGTQFRYVVSPRATLTADVREGYTSYPKTPDNDSASTFILAGGDFIFTPRLRTTTEIGAQIRSYQSGGGGGAQTTPYLENSIVAAFYRGTTLQWTNRFGFEDSGAVAQRSVSYRTGLNLNYVLSARLIASAGVAYNHISSTGGSSGSPSLSEDQFQSSLGLQYVLSKAITIDLSYSLTEVFGNEPGIDYSRSQIFLGASYSF